MAISGQYAVRIVPRLRSQCPTVTGFTRSTKASFGTLKPCS